MYSYKNPVYETFQMNEVGLASTGRIFRQKRSKWCILLCVTCVVAFEACVFALGYYASSQCVHEITVTGITKALYDKKDHFEKIEWFRQLSLKNKFEVVTKFDLTQSETRNILDGGTTDSQRVTILTGDGNVLKKYGKTTECFNNETCSHMRKEIFVLIDEVQSKLHKPVYVEPSRSGNDLSLWKQLNILNTRDKELTAIIKKTESFNNADKILLSTKIKQIGLKLIGDENRWDDHYFKTMLSNLPNEIDPQNFDIKKFSSKLNLKHEGNREYTYLELLQQETEATVKMGKIINKEVNTMTKTKILKQIDKTKLLLPEDIRELKHFVDESDNKDSSENIKNQIKDVITEKQKEISQQSEAFKKYSQKRDKCLYMLKKVNSRIGSVSTINGLNGISNGISAIYSATFKFDNGSAINVLSGALDIVSALGTFLGPSGMALAALAGLSNTVLSLIGAGGPTQTQLMADMINNQTKQIQGMFIEQTKVLLIEFEEIKKHSDHNTRIILREIEQSTYRLSNGQKLNKFYEMKNLIDGIKDKLTNTNIVLKVFREGFPITDTGTVQNEVTILGETKDFGILMSYIFIICLFGKNVRFCHVLIYSYVILAGMRDSVLTDLFNIYKRSSHPDSDILAEAVYRVLKNIQEEDRKDLTKLITNSNNPYCVTACMMNGIKNKIKYTKWEMEDYNNSPLQFAEIELVHQYLDLVGAPAKEKFNYSLCEKCYLKQDCKTTERDSSSHMCISEWSEWEYISECIFCGGHRDCQHWRCGDGTRKMSRKCRLKNNKHCGGEKEMIVECHIGPDPCPPTWGG